MNYSYQILQKSFTQGLSPKNEYDLLRLIKNVLGKGEIKARVLKRAIFFHGTTETEVFF